MTGQETIFSLSSGAGKAGVAVIRVSGPAAKSCLEKLQVAVPAARQASVRVLTDPADGSVVDRALVLWMPGPGSFTGEDTCELHVHGGRAVVRRVLSVLGRIEGCRLAEAGEFTSRAFLNGRLDLTEVEGLADLIAAETEAQRRQAMFASEGSARTLHEGWRQSLLTCHAHVEAAIDFSDEDGVEAAALAGISDELRQLQGALEQQLADGKRSEIIREGVKVVLAGPVNAGKSSLLNCLAGRDAAIVSEEAGTTRDVVEVRMDLAGIPVIISDTAGFRDDATSQVEHEGMARAKRALRAADLVLWLDAVGDAPRQTPVEFDSKAFRVLNKADLGVPPDCASYDYVVSVRTGLGMDRLMAGLTDSLAQWFSGHEPTLVSRQRHRDAVETCLDHVRSALEGVERGESLEFVAEHLRLAGRALARLAGRIDVEDLLDAIFSEFCIGK